MPRKRQIDPDLWTSEQVITLPIGARLLFIGMISHADDKGRLRGSPLSLKATIFPGDTCSSDEIKGWRDAIVKNKLAIFYTNNEAEYLWLPSFCKFQYMTKRFPSKLPPPSGGEEQPVNNELITKAQHLYGGGVGIEVDNGIEVEDDKSSSSLLNLLLALPQWGKSQVGSDRKWLAEFLQEFPEFYISHVKACRDYHSSKTSHSKASWKNRLRNWMEKAREIKGIKDPVKAGKKAIRVQQEDDTVHIPATPEEKEKAKASRQRIGKAIRGLAEKKKL